MFIMELVVYMSMPELVKLVEMLEELYPEKVKVGFGEDGEVIADVDVSNAHIWLHIEDVGAVYVNNVDILEIRAREFDGFTDLEVEFQGETDDPYDLNASFGELSSSAENAICIEDGGFTIRLGSDVEISVRFLKVNGGGDGSE